MFLDRCPRLMFKNSPCWLLCGVCGSELTQTSGELAGDHGHTHGARVPGSRRGGLWEKPLSLYAKLLGNSFLLPLSDVPLGASREDRNYPCPVPAGLAAWAGPCVWRPEANLGLHRAKRASLAERPVRRLFQTDSGRALGNPEQDRGRMSARAWSVESNVPWTTLMSHV